MTDTKDIADRLRGLAECLRGEASGECAESLICDEAAAKIDELREELREAHWAPFGMWRVRLGEA